MSPTEPGHRVRFVNHLSHRALGVGFVVAVDPSGPGIVKVLFSDGTLDCWNFDSFRRSFFVL